MHTQHHEPPGQPCQLPAPHTCQLTAPPHASCSYSLRQSLWYSTFGNLMVFETKQGMEAFVAAFEAAAQQAPAQKRQAMHSSFERYPMVSLDGAAHNSGRAGRRGWQRTYQGLMLQVVPRQVQLEMGVSLDGRWGGAGAWDGRWRQVLHMRCCVLRMCVSGVDCCVMRVVLAHQPRPACCGAGAHRKARPTAQ